MLIITADDIFHAVKQRSDFKSDIDTMMADLTACLNAIPPVPLPTASSGNKGINNVIAACPPVSARKINVLNNWKENLLYAKPATAITVNGQLCSAVLIFGGAKTTSQVRNTISDKSNSNNYLEGSNATSFPNGTTYSGTDALLNGFNKTNPGSDLLACIP